MDYLVTGGAGFIGRHLIPLLGSATIVDTVPRGPDTVVTDISLPSSQEALDRAAKGKSAIFHLAANPEVRVGDPELHLSVGAFGTLRVLEAARKADVGKLIFASSSVVYGEASLQPTPEDYPTSPISSYGAAKLAAEALISAYASYYGMQAVSLRLANVVGGDAPRGVLRDFMTKLRANPRELQILGDGTQTKSYFHVDDCAAGFYQAINWGARGKNSVFNLGAQDALDVLSIARITAQEMGIDSQKVKLVLAGGPDGRGWMGDIKYAWLSIEKAKGAGWRPKFPTSEQAIRQALREMLKGST